MPTVISPPLFSVGLTDFVIFVEIRCLLPPLSIANEVVFNLITYFLQIQISLPRFVFSIDSFFVHMMNLQWWGISIPKKNQPFFVWCKLLLFLFLEMSVTFLWTD
jgi:hypothetical protein